MAAAAQGRLSGVLDGLKPKRQEAGTKAMSTKRVVEVFSSGCFACDDTVALVSSIACGSCEVTVHDVRQEAGENRAKELGIRSFPAVVVDGQLASCCTGRGVESAALQAAGVGSPIP